MKKKTLSLLCKFGFRFACFAVVLLLLFSAFIYFVFVVLVDDSVEKKEIFSLVTEHQTDLEAYIEKQDFSKPPVFDEIKTVRVQKDTIEFSCGGSGLGAATYYCGFYYSPNDDLYGLWCAPPNGSSLMTFGNGFLYEETNGDNRYYTEHICGHFYYYEASF